MPESKTTELASPTSMEDVKERIALRIKASFVELMPEEAWSKMVQAEITEFTMLHAHDYRGNRRYSNLQMIIHEVLEQRYREMLKVELAKPEYGGHFGVNGQVQPGEFIKSFLRENMTEILTVILEGMGQRLVEQVKDSIRQNMATVY